MAEIPVTSLPLRLQRQVDQARTAFDRGNTEYTINICRDVLKAQPGCLAVRRVLRVAQMKIFKAKNRLWAKAVGGLSSAPALMSGQAQVRKDPAKAMESAESVLGADPTNVAALRLLAQAALALDLPETAAFALEAVLEHSPNNRGVLVQLADAYIGANRVREAMVIAERLLAEEPANMEIQELLKRASVAQSINAGRWDSESGSFRDKLRDEDEAVSIEQGHKVVASGEMTERLLAEHVARVAGEPSNLNHYRAVINACRTLGRLDDALAWLARARALPMGASDVTLEKLESELRLESHNDRVQAREAAVTAAKGDPAQDPELLRLRAEYAQARIAELRAFVDKFPNEYGYKFELGELYRGAGDLDLAIQQFQQTQRGPRYRLGSLMNLGACFQAKRLFDLAVQQYETAKKEILVFDEQKKETIYQLAVCLEAMGQAGRALEEYKLIYSADIGFRDVAAKIDKSYLKS